MVKRDQDFRQARRTDARSFMQRRKNEEVKRDDCGGGVTGEGEDETVFSGAGGSFERDCGEGGGFAGFHGDAAEVD